MNVSRILHLVDFGVDNGFDLVSYNANWEGWTFMYIYKNSMLHRGYILVTLSFQCYILVTLFFQCYILATPFAKGELIFGNFIIYI